MKPLRILGGAIAIVLCLGQTANANEAVYEAQRALEMWEPQHIF